jgi:hypothetical protein
MTPGMKMSLRLAPDERDLLKHLYLRYKIPSDQYDRRPGDLRQFVREWNALSGRQDSGADLLHYIKTQRKQKLWVTFEEGDYLRQPFVELPDLSPEEWGVFDRLYKERNVASDNYSYSPTMVKQFAARLSGELRRTISPKDLLIMVIDRRKDGLLPLLEKPVDMGFGDLDLVEKRAG